MQPEQWIPALREQLAQPTAQEEARELIHGMPSAEWKATRQTPATEEQLARMQASVAKNAQE